MKWQHVQRSNSRCGSLNFSRLRENIASPRSQRIFSTDLRPASLERYKLLNLRGCQRALCAFIQGSETTYCSPGPREQEKEIVQAFLHKGAGSTSCFLALALEVILRQGVCSGLIPWLDTVPKNWWEEYTAVRWGISCLCDISSVYAVFIYSFQLCVCALHAYMCVYMCMRKCMWGLRSAVSPIHSLLRALSITRESSPWGLGSLASLLRGPRFCLLELELKVGLYFHLTFM